MADVVFQTQEGLPLVKRQEGREVETKEARALPASPSCWLPGGRHVSARSLSGCRYTRSGRNGSSTAVRATSPSASGGPS